MGLSDVWNHLTSKKRKGGSSPQSSSSFNTRSSYTQPSDIHPVWQQAHYAPSVTLPSDTQRRARKRRSFWRQTATSDVFNDYPSPPSRKQDRWSTLHEASALASNGSRPDDNGITVGSLIKSQVKKTARRLSRSRSRMSMTLRRRASFFGGAPDSDDDIPTMPPLPIYTAPHWPVPQVHELQAYCETDPAYAGIAYTNETVQTTTRSPTPRGRRRSRGRSREISRQSMHNETHNVDDTANDSGAEAPSVPMTKHQHQHQRQFERRQQRRDAEELSYHGFTSEYKRASMALRTPSPSLPIPYEVEADRSSFVTATAWPDVNEVEAVIAATAGIVDAGADDEISSNSTANEERDTEDGCEEGGEIGQRTWRRSHISLYSVEGSDDGEIMCMSDAQLLRWEKMKHVIRIVEARREVGALGWMGQIMDGKKHGRGPSYANAQALAALEFGWD